MGIRVIGGYYGALRNGGITLHEAMPKLVGLSFLYLCSLVYPDDAGPNFGMVNGDQVTDVFDLLRVRYDGQKVVATKTDDHLMVGYELVGGRYEYEDGTFDEVDLATLDQFIRHHPTALVKSPMTVQTIKARKVGDAINGETFSGQWQLGDSQGFQRLAVPLSDDLQMEVAKLCQNIDQVATAHGAVVKITGNQVTAQQFMYEVAVRRANVAAWYDLSRRKVDFVQALSSVRLASLANLKYANALKQELPR